MLLSFTIGVTKAQVTNFAVSNTLTTFEYQGYSNGQYHFEISARTKCPVSGIIKLDNVAATFPVNIIPGHSSVTVAVTAPLGANILTFLGDYGECDCNCGTNILQICLSILPVKWGEISAYNKNGELVVNWTTETESLNDHFVIMGSADGIHFEKITEVKSKAENGISSIPIKYSVEMPFSTKMAAGFFALGFLGLVISKPKKKKRFLIPVIFLISALAFTFISCQKEDSSLQKDSKVKFVQIVQINKDGNSHNSEVIRVR